MLALCGTKVPQGRSNAIRWDIFIAHAGADEDAAEELFDLLRDRCVPFLDSRSLKLGDDWDRQLSLAQLESRLTAVLVSNRTDDAFYEREEIARAIDLARRPYSDHRVVPIYLDGELVGGSEAPYGLRLKHGITLGAEDTLQIVADRLIELLQGMSRPSDLSTTLRDSPQLMSDRLGWLRIDDVTVSTRRRRVELDVSIRNVGRATVNVTRADVAIIERTPLTGSYQASGFYRLRIEGEHNFIAIRHVLQPGEVDAFVLKMGFTKHNSCCEFKARLLLRYNGENEAASTPFRFASVFGG